MRPGGQASRSQTPCPTRGSPGATSAWNQRGFGLVAPERKAFTFKFLGHQVPCLLFSFLLGGILLIPECKSHHVGDNVGTHKHCAAKGPAFNH